MKRKYVKRDYASMNPITVYNIVRRGELKKFPNNYLDKATIKVIVRHVLLKEQRLTREEIVKNVNYGYLMKLNMGGFRKFFDLKIYKLVSYCFPEMNIKAWEMCKVEAQFWDDKENQKDFLLWIMEKEELNPYSKEDLRKITARMVIDYGGARMLKTEEDLYSILCTVCGDTFKEWEIMKIRSWKEEKVKAAVIWLVEEKMCYTLEQACNLRVKDFKDNNLDGMLQKACNHSILNALNLAYGNRFIRVNSKKIVLAN